MKHPQAVITLGRIVTIIVAILPPIIVFLITFMSYSNITYIPYILPTIISAPVPFALIYIHDHFQKYPKPSERVGIPFAYLAHMELQYRIPYL